MMRQPPRFRRVRVEDVVDRFVVLPGEIYTTTCRPLESAILSDVLVRDFSIDKLIVGDLDTATEERATAEGSRVYQPKRLLLVRPSMEVTIVLRNTTRKPLRVLQAAFQEEKTS